MKSARADRVAELARTLMCEHLLAYGYHRGIAPIWLVRLLVSRLTLASLLERLQRR